MRYLNEIKVTGMLFILGICLTVILFSGTKKVNAGTEPDFAIVPDSSTDFQLVKSGDTEKSLVLKTAGTTKTLAISFGDVASANCTWTSDNEDVVTVNQGVVTVVGAGTTTISVSYLPEGSTTLRTDDIDVYVLPTVQSSAGVTDSIAVHSNQEADCLVTDTVYAKQDLKITDKMEWVITKEIDGAQQIVADSIDATSDLITINPSTPKQKIKVVGKAENYEVLFFPKGVYSDLKNHYDITEMSTSLYTKINLKIYGEFSDKNIYLTKGDSFDLMTAFNVDKDTFNTFFATSLDLGCNVVQYESGNLCATAVGVGDAVIEVRIADEVEVSKYVDGSQPSSGKYNVTIHVSDSLRLDRHSVTIAKGASLQLSPISDMTDNPVTFSTSDATYVSVNDNGLMKGLTVTTDDIAVTATMISATGNVYRDVCYVKVVDSVTDISITSDADNLSIGEQMIVTSNLTNSSANASIKWISSDEEVVSITAASDNRSAIIKGNKAGTVAITCINTDNMVASTITIHVMNRVTSLSLEEKKATVQLEQKYYCVKPVYELVIEGTMEFTYVSSDDTIASVEDNGLVTLKKVGTVSITVSPQYNPTNLYATCSLNIVETPTVTPTPQPTVTPTPQPTATPAITAAPTGAPTSTPTAIPTIEPTGTPTAPAIQPTQTPAVIITTNPTVTPTAKPVVMKSMTKAVHSSKSKNKIRWTKVSGADGYHIYMTRCGKNEKKTKMMLYITINSDNITSYVHSGLKKNTWYKYKITAFRLVDGREMEFGKSLELHAVTASKKSKYVNVTKVKVSNAKVAVRVGKTKKITVEPIVPKNKKTKWHIEKIRYIISDASVASISKAGRITAKKKGKCLIYAVAQNGVSKKIRVTVE